MKKTVFFLAIFLSLIWPLVATAADFNGDGYDDIAVFRSSSGLWAVRTITRIYFGAYGDIPAAGNYAGSAAAEVAIFRPDSGLWAVRGVTRIYYGRAGDTPVTGQGNSLLAMKEVDVFGGLYTLNPRYPFYLILNWSSSSNIELSLGDGSTPGQLLVIAIGSSSEDTILADTGNVRLAGEWRGESYDTITLIWDGNLWLETSRSDN